MKRLIMISLIGLSLVVGVMPAELGETSAPAVMTIRVAEPNPNPYHRLYEEMLYPVVRIETPDGVGSGVVIPSYNVTKLQRYNETLKQCNTETYILTAAHVVGNESTVTVTFYTPLNPLLLEGTCMDESPLERGRGVLSFCAFVVITDTAKDLALLRINRDCFADARNDIKVRFARLAPRDYTPYIFTPVWVVGCSLGLDPRPSFGHITAITTPFNSPLTKGDLGGCWEVSAPIVPGNSGGPVYAECNGVPPNGGNAKTYQVIGIAVWVRTYHGQLITTMAGVVPIQTVYEFLDNVYPDVVPQGGTHRGLTRCNDQRSNSE